MTPLEGATNMCQQHPRATTAFTRTIARIHLVDKTEHFDCRITASLLDVCAVYSAMCVRRGQGGLTLWTVSGSRGVGDRCLVLGPDTRRRAWEDEVVRVCPPGSANTIPRTRAYRTRTEGVFCERVQPARAPVSPRTHPRPRALDDRRADGREGRGRGLCQRKEERRSPKVPEGPHLEVLDLDVLLLLRQLPVLARAAAPAPRRRARAPLRRRRRVPHVVALHLLLVRARARRARPAVPARGLRQHRRRHALHVEVLFAPIAVQRFGPARAAVSGGAGSGDEEVRARTEESISRRCRTVGGRPAGRTRPRAPRQCTRTATLACPECAWALSNNQTTLNEPHTRSTALSAPRTVADRRDGDHVELLP